MDPWLLTTAALTNRSPRKQVVTPSPESYQGQHSRLFRTPAINTKSHSLLSLTRSKSRKLCLPAQAPITPPVMIPLPAPLVWSTWTSETVFSSGRFYPPRWSLRSPLRRQSSPACSSDSYRTTSLQATFAILSNCAPAENRSTAQRSSSSSTMEYALRRAAAMPTAIRMTQTPLLPP